MDACQSTKMNGVSHVYLIDSQADASIFSGQIGYINIFLRGINTGKDVTIYCSENDYCTIDCGYFGDNINPAEASSACNQLSLYCFGKCIIKCNETIDITCPNVLTSVAPSGAPTIAPTYSPTDSPTIEPTVEPTLEPTISPTKEPTIESLGARLTENDIESTMSWTLLIFFIIGGILIICGFIDKLLMTKNELFNAKSIMAFLFYTTDFTSDWFFCGKLFLLINELYYLILFIFSILFIIIPLGANIFQLQKQIKIWNFESKYKYKYKRHSNESVNQWIKRRVKFMYILTFLSGSSFSMIELCNSYLFHLKTFSMGLSRRQKSVFRNKRVFSVVLLEVKPSVFAIVVCTVPF